MTTRIPTRSRRQAMDWSLALVSQGIECTIEHSESGWGLIVASGKHDHALRTVQQYDAENGYWPWRQSIRPKILFDWGSLAWVLLICLFFWLAEKKAILQTVGLMDSAAVSRGQWWRLFTAIYLHADPGHLALNASLGLLLLGLTMGGYGTGVGLLAAYLAGAGGNVATWIVFKQHHSLGASGMVMGCVGLLAVHSFSMLSSNRRALRYVISGMASGVMLFILMGLSPGSDVLAHFGGFVTGLLLGSCLTLNPRFAGSKGINACATGLFCLLVILTWGLAVAHSPGLQ